MTAITKPFFVVPITATMTANNSVSGYPVTNLVRFKDKGLVWQSTGTIWCKGNFGSAQSIDFIGLIGTNAQAGTQIRVRLGSSSGAVDGGSATYDSGTIDITAVGGTAMPHAHIELNSPVSAQWMRIDITSHSGTFEAMAVVAGKKLTPDRFYDFGFGFGGKDLGAIDINRLGVVDEKPGVKFRTVDFTLSWQTESDYETYFRPMVEAVGTTGVVYCCFDPTATVYRTKRTFFGWMKDYPYARGTRKSHTFQQEFSLLSMI